MLAGHCWPEQVSPLTANAAAPEPDNVIELTSSDAVPSLITVIVWLADWPVSVFGKETELGLKVAWAWIPVPLRANWDGPFHASSATFNVADSGPVVAGVKLTGTVQDVLGATAAPTHVPAPVANELAFVPVIDTDDTCRVSLPAFVRINPGDEAVTPTR